MHPDPKRPGRPPLDSSGAPSAEVHLRLPAGVFDKVEKAAAARRESVQELIRRELHRIVQDQRG